MHNLLEYLYSLYSPLARTVEFAIGGFGMSQHTTISFPKATQHTRCVVVKNGTVLNGFIRYATFMPNMARTILEVYGTDPGGSPHKLQALVHAPIEPRLDVWSLEVLREDGAQVFTRNNCQTVIGSDPKGCTESYYKQVHDFLQAPATDLRFSLTLSVPWMLDDIKAELNNE